MEIIREDCDDYESLFLYQCEKGAKQVKKSF